MFNNDFSREIWKTTYKHHSDETPQDTFKRVSRALASVESDELVDFWEAEFYNTLSDFKTTLGGRIYANAGSEWETTAINCFVGPKPKYDQDSLDGILSVLRSQCQTLKSEGGWGMNFSFIRPRGAFIKGIGVESPGSVKYMEIFDKTSDVITAGSGKKSVNKLAKGKIRKGAMMSVLDCVSGETEVWTLDGKIQIKNLVGETPLVYCTDLNGGVRVRKANKVWSKGVKRVVRIKFDDDSYLKCTPEHEILLSDGTYRKAEDLKFKDSVCVLHKRLYLNYYQLGITGVRKSIPEHVAVAEYKYGRFPAVSFNENGAFNNYSEDVHHIDYSTINNKVDNIEILTRIEHTKAHFERNVKILSDAREKLNKERRGKTWEEFYGEDKAKKVRHTWLEARRRNKKPAWNTGLTGENYKKHFDNGFSNQFAVNSNHKVVSVEDFGEEEVFDISVPEFHNFVANGVFVHNCSHPDVEEFITAKLTPGRLSKFNLSVNCSNEFMDRVQEVERIKREIKEQSLNGFGPSQDLADSLELVNKWDLIFPDTTFDKYKQEWDGNITLWKSKNYPVIVYKTVKVDALWELIMQSTNQRNDPGILFLDRANATHCWNYGKDSYIGATNPCFSGDTLLGTADGRSAVSIKQLTEEGRDIPVYSVNKNTGMAEIKWGRNPRITGYDKELLRLTLDDDSHLDVTPNHKFITMDGREVEAKELKAGDSLPRFFERKENPSALVFSNATSEAINKIPKTHVSHELTRKMEEARRTGLKALILDGELMVEKTCEYTGELFTVPWERREICLRPGVNPTSVKQIEYKALKEVSNTYNHRIAKIEKLEGKHTVYNITVEDNHTVAIVTSSNSKGFSGVYTMQCGEQNLPFSGACNLGSINLTQFIENGKFNLEKLSKHTKVLVRLLDNVNDYTKAPLPEYIESITRRRRIGMGVMGWGSALYMMKVRFASDKAEQMKSEMMKVITHSAVSASIDLAIEKGMFPDCEPEKHAKSMFFEQIGLPESEKERIRKYGIRNSALFSIQPTGNTSIFANIVSGGLEPVFMPEYVRTSIVNSPPDDVAPFIVEYRDDGSNSNGVFKYVSEGGDKILRGEINGIVYKIDKNRGLTKETLCEDYGVSYLKKLGEWDEKADWAVTTETLTVEEHLRDMTGFGKWIDSSMSKTVNVPNSYDYESFKSIYLRAYQSGVLKGVTTYRAGTMATVLSSTKDKEESVKIYKTTAPKRPKELNGEIFTLKYKKENLYVVAGFLGSDLYEVFVGVNPKHDIEHAKGKIIKNGRGKYVFVAKDGCEYHLNNGHSDENADALCRVLSASLRHGCDLSFLIHQLEKTQGDLTSFAKVICRVLKKFIKEGVKISGEQCPACNHELIRTEGCKKCKNCDWSACG